VHLPTAGLLKWKIDVNPEPLQKPYRSGTSLGENGIDYA
jgi:hypothetical protein